MLCYLLASVDRGRLTCGARLNALWMRAARSRQRGNRMIRRKFITLVCGVSIAWIANSKPGSASPVGRCQANDGGKIRISACGQALCGFVTRTNPPQAKDKNNADPA